jgi:hypothetical protein
MDDLIDRKGLIGHPDFAYDVVRSDDMSCGWSAIRRSEAIEQ